VIKIGLLFSADTAKVL